MNKTDEYINKIKQDTNNNQDIIIREKIMNICILLKTKKLIKRTKMSEYKIYSFVTKM